MFTGIVEERGEVVAVEALPNGARLTVAGPLVTSDARLGDSIAVSGVCLTVVDVTDDRFTVDVVRETLTRSSLDRVRVGDRVNLETDILARHIARLQEFQTAPVVEPVGTIASAQAVSTDSTAAEHPKEA